MLVLWLDNVDFNDEANDTIVACTGPSCTASVLNIILW